MRQSVPPAVRFIAAVMIGAGIGWLGHAMWPTFNPDSVRVVEMWEPARPLDRMHFVVNKTDADAFASDYKKAHPYMSVRHCAIMPEYGIKGVYSPLIPVVVPNHECQEIG